MKTHVRHELLNSHIKILSGIIKALEDKKASNIKILDLRSVSGFADYMVICSGSSSVHVRSIVSNVKDNFKKEDGLVYVNSSKDDSWWILDFVDVVVHIFKEEVRNFYDLERLWNDAPLVSP